MAPKRLAPLERPPAASCEEEGSSSSSSGEDEEDGSSSEDEQPQLNQLKMSSSPLAQTQTPKSAAKKPQSESDSETESDSHSGGAPYLTVKAIASKPMQETPAKTTKAKSRPSVSFQVNAKATVKRSNEVERDANDSKRAKKKEAESDGVVDKSEDMKKQLFQRLWSENDEITLLKGIIDFTQKKRVDPIKDMSSFHDFIKKSLHFDVALSQLKDKVSRLKKKYENHSKGKHGENKTFSKAHDQEAFNLSKLIWGSEGICGAGVESSAKSTGKTMENHSSLKVATIRPSVFDKCWGVVGMENYVAKWGLDMVEGEKKAEMEAKWRKQHVAELQLFLKRNELIIEQAKLMLAAYKTEYE